VFLTLPNALLLYSAGYSTVLQPQCIDILHWWIVIAMYNVYNGRLRVFENSVLRRIFGPKRGWGEVTGDQEK
jgi:hypothetical protein